jgi:hypothetical protein
MRTYNEIVETLLQQLPRQEEVRTLTNEQLERICCVGNIIGNVAYVELMRRSRECQNKLNAS